MYKIHFVLPKSDFLTSWLSDKSEYASEELRDDPEVVRTSIQKDGTCLMSGCLSQWRNGEFLISGPKSYWPGVEKRRNLT